MRNQDAPQGQGADRGPGGDRGAGGERGERGERAGRQPRRFGRRKVCPFCADKTLYIDYKTPSMLKRFISERGKIVPRRISGVCAQHQRNLCLEIKRARIMAFMPYSSATAD